MKTSTALVATLTLVFCSVSAAEFVDGPVITGFGKHTAVTQTFALDKQSDFKVAFDVAEAGENNKVNRRFDTVARFLNMHVANGVDADKVQLALVVHGKAGFDLLNNRVYQAKYQRDNPNAKLIELLQSHQVKVIICGQSAAYYQIDNADLLEGVTVALSAMTAHAMLAQQGYSTNPL